MTPAIKMYTLKPVIIHDFPVQLPNCMYKLKSIHRPTKVDGAHEHVSSPAQKVDIFDQNCKEIPGMAELEAKQKDILEQLAELKRQISSLKQDLRLRNDSGSKGISSSISCARPILNHSLPDTIVVNANPSSPPFSLLLLQRLLQDQIGLCVTSYLHSSVPALPESAIQLRDSLDNFKPPAKVPQIKVRLIWKNITSNTEFLLSHTSIAGEVNLLRYLSRLAATKLSYDSEANSLEIDSLLDQCYLLVRAKTKTEKAAILQVFNKSLSKSQWLVGRNQVGIADVTAYSAIKQCSLASNDLSANLGKWFQNCGTLVSS